ncbi:MAG: glycosyltransferase [Bacteroidales bacterium]|nr:glycosyltransferase [Bacteroidales bacterium]MDD4670561.1 glycosyltransferase [Bacteroidales bacterium]
MKIAYLSTFFPFRGGIAQFNANLYLELKKEHEVTAYTFTRQYPDFLFPGQTQYVTDKDKAIPIDSVPVLDTINPFSYFSAAHKIASQHPDLVIMKYWMSYLAPALGMVAKLLKKRGIKVITILDNVIPHEAKFFDRPFSKWFLKQNSGCIAMSEAVLDDMLSLTPSKPHILQAHPLYDHFGLKMEKEKAVAQSGIEPGKRNLLFFGLIRDYKGLDLLIEAMNLLGDEYQLVIAGESYGSFEKYDRQIAAVTHPQRIKKFIHYIDDDMVPVFFSACDVCVLPYKTATQSGITAISMHFDLPLIATRTGGLAESIEKPGIGIMCDDITSDSIAKAIGQYFADGSDNFTANIQKAKQTMTWKVFADSLIKFYNLI